MKFFRPNFFAALVALILISGASFCNAAEKSVAILPLEIPENYEYNPDEENAPDILYDELVTAVENSTRYFVVDTGRLDEVLEETGLQSLMSDPEYSSEINSLYGAEYLVAGKIVKLETEAADTSNFFKKIMAKLDSPFRTKIVFDVTVTNSGNGKTILSKVVEVSRGGKDEKNSVADACKDTAKKFVEELETVDTVRR